MQNDNTSNTQALLSMEDISKTFPGVKALDAASLGVAAGEIHGLVGENGAGKSTIIKVLAGVYGRDSGTIVLDGKALADVTPHSVHEAGVRFIHQELHLVPHFTVAESVFMGQEITGPFGLDRRAMRTRTEQFLSESLHTSISGSTLIRDLGIAERKLVQIARALIDDKARLVVFDEPTAPLASGEIDQLFAAIRRLKERGIAIIYVSHYLGEITELCDRVTVFRNGVDVAVLDHVDSHSADTIIEHMVGRELEALYPGKSHRIGDTLLDISQLSDGSRFRDVDLCVRRGEIVGVAGLIGSGREELTDTIYGLRQATSGTVTFDGDAINLKAPWAAVQKGIVLVPRDRRHDGLILDMTVGDNINLASLDEVASFRIENREKAARRAEALSDKIDIRPRRVEAVTRFLSGGNQQKVVLARWLATGSKLFILDEPTVGVDIGAKVEIYQLIEDLAKEGAGVLVSSSDPAELLGLCDRIIILMRGRVVEDRPAAELTIDSLLALTTGGHVKAASA
ncbi:MAG: sugar ABC transporter ATP-binding protein [Alphaproteobacteria bacterium]|nr:sugar ABC transporter ATP-binding protein [Alphaproteobacteria bacterium]